MENVNIVTEVEAYLNKYVLFAEDFYSLPCALWLIATHCWPEFDAFPYMGISARTKKAGKTTLKDCMVPVAANGRKFSVSSISSMFRVLEKNPDDPNSGTFPTMFVDECEALANENHPGREFINKGFERGETMTRTINNKVVDFDCYCPKVFVGIGGVYDTLRDRSVIIMMRRRTPVEAARFERIRANVRDSDGQALRALISEKIKENLGQVRDLYAAAEMLDFIDERAEKCWTPLFIMAKIFCPDRVEELTRIAVDMEADKDAPATKATGDEWERAERAADDEESRILLMRDLLKVIGDEDYLTTQDAIEKLHGLTTAGWRRFRGRGLSAEDMGNLLDSLNIHPGRIYLGGGRKNYKQLRGYKKKDLIAAATLAGLIEK